MIAERGRAPCRTGPSGNTTPPKTLSRLSASCGTRSAAAPGKTHASIRKNFLEETCEALEALDADDPDMIREELGDVLMQVVFHAVMEEERGRLDFEQVCREVCEKLVFRHPNIFTSSAAENAGINSWDALKNKEKGRKTIADELDTVPATLPALMRAQKLQKRAASHGVGEIDPVNAAAALKTAEAAWDAHSAENAQQTAGELLMAAANAMRLEGVDAEEALTSPTPPPDHTNG